jgi:hypothetical protein
MLPPNEHTFELMSDGGKTVVGDKTGKKYEGSFTVKCVLTNAESIRVAVNTERYCEGQPGIPAYYRLFNRAIAEAEVRVRFDKDKGRPMAPGWWIDAEAGRELFDQNVVFDIYNQCMAAEKAWKDKVNGSAKESEKAAGETTTTAPKNS